MKFENQNKIFWLVIGILSIAVLGIVDHLTGPEFAFSLFYLLPISLVVWYTNKILGIVISILSAIMWLAADVTAGHLYSNSAIYFWNTIVRLGFFLTVTLLLSALRKEMDHAKKLANMDPLTDAVNTRFFFDLAKMEMNRSSRYKHPFTVAYLDLDNFKNVNDQLGHLKGDQILRTVVCSIKQHLRNTDVVARVGGDEFVLLLPETDQQGAQAAISKIRLSLSEEMQKQNLPVTFSIGVLTYLTIPQTVDETIKMVDDLMYSVKKNGKNAITYSVYAC